ncbi:UDP-glucose 6-dehydrogenase [bacterium]|nr:MAG: UDP-glucose 6-dehydrogenase [bacterium]
MDGKIGIIGTGYVGLVAGVCFAMKYPVVCVDVDSEKVDAINDGIAPFYEPKLDELLQKVSASGNISATTDIEQAVRECDYIFISVGTPSMHSGEIDLRYVKAVARDIGKSLRNMDKYIVIIQRSTVVPTTTRDMVGKIIAENSGKTTGEHFGIAFVPEFLREGNAVDDFLEPDRIIIGTEDKKVEELLHKLYADFYSQFPEDKIISMSIESAELVKYASNSFLAGKISFANEIASLAELIPGVDIVDVMAGVGMDHRISEKYFGAGAGFGGSCFPKDIKALIHFARTKAFEPIILEAILERNNRQAMHIVDLIEDIVSSIHTARITILGLSFKPGTSDMRDAPSLKIISELIERGAGEIVGYDPKANDEARQILGNRIKYADNVQDALRGANIAVVLTEWDEFRKLTPAEFKKCMAESVLVDARRIYNYDEFSSQLKFYAVGRKHHN